MDDLAVSESRLPGPTPARASPAPGAKRRPLSRRKRIAFATTTCVFFFGAVELVLALFGVEPLYLSRDPYVGFQPGIPLFVRDGDVWRTNPAKRAFFNDQSFPAVKARHAYRIFCLGGSTTFGHPYHDSTSYCGWLRELLRETGSERDWQVVNCGGVSYASYRECLLMQELVRYQPDLFVVLSGHNEFLEERSYRALRERTRVRETLDFVVARSRTGAVVGAVANRLVNRRPARSRSRQWLSAEVDTILEHSLGPSDYHRDVEHRQGVVRHFRDSLARMCAIARAAGARVIFISPASNLRDFTPFKSEHGREALNRLTEWDSTSHRPARRRGDIEEAVRLALAAARLDPQHAYGLWDAADALFAAGRYEEAHEYFLRSVDEDICPLRASRSIREVVKSVATENGVRLIDFPAMLEQELEQTRGHRIAGDESFLDHVHPTIEVHRRLAWEIYDRLVAWQWLQPPPDREQVTGRVTLRVMSQIDSRAQALALVQVIQVLSWAGKNQEALRLTERAEEVHPGLSEVVNYRGRLLEKLGHADEAFECYQEAVRRNPEDSVALYRLAFAQSGRGEFVAASENFEQAVRLTPEAAPASFRSSLHLGLGRTYMELGRWDEAVVQFAESLRQAPGDSMAEQLLATARWKSILIRN